MRILYLTFYFEPDLCAGSFRNSSLVQELSASLGPDNLISVVTTMPNRYSSFSEKAVPYEKTGNTEVFRIKLPHHKSGFTDQAFAFKTFFIEALRISRNQQFDMVFASSSRIFTAFLGSFISRKKNIPLYLDIRDIFVDTMKDVIKSRLIKFPLLIVLNNIEKYTFSRATHINLISEGFKPYFKKYRKPKYSYFTNGIDTEFLNLPESTNLPDSELIITYAGNIGEGQGLHKIIPHAAALLGPGYKFRIIGDGGKKKELLDLVQAAKIGNFEILPPVSRKELIEYYNQSHFLFMHLNDYEAFEKVLPSKVFEYGASDKPIIAGVGGFASEFIESNLTNYILFPPGDVQSLVHQLEKYHFKFLTRNSFKENFARENINKEMAVSIINCQIVR